MTNDAVVSTEGRNLLRQESLSFPELLSRYKIWVVREYCKWCDLRPSRNVATRSGSGFLPLHPLHPLQPLQRMLSSLRHFSGIPTQPELLTTLTSFKGHALLQVPRTKAN